MAPLLASLTCLLLVVFLQSFLLLLRASCLRLTGGNLMPFPELHRLIYLTFAYINKHHQRETSVPEKALSKEDFCKNAYPQDNLRGFQADRLLCIKDRISGCKF